jgi:hypothetical protein
VCAPGEWWHALFRKHGAVVNEEMLWAMQEKDFSMKGDKLKDCRWEGKQDDGGLYEVCLAGAYTRLPFSST